MLDDVGQGFRDEEVRGELDGVGQPIAGRSFHGDGQRRPARERLDRRLEPLVAEERRMDPTGESRSSAIASSTSSWARESISASAASPRDAASPSVRESVTSRC